jgi:hypothetical protein
MVRKFDYGKKYHVLEPINTIHMPEFAGGLEKAGIFQRIGRLK